MGRSLTAGVSLCAFFCLANQLFATTAPGLYDPGPGKYLSYFESARNAGILLEDARSEYQIAIDKEHKDTLLLEMYTKLRAKGAVTEEDFRLSKAQQAVAVAQIQVWKDKVEWLTNTVAFNTQGADVSAGAVVDLDKIHAMYMAEWQAQCRVFKSEILAAEAKLSLAAYRQDVARKLNVSRAMAYSEVLDREFEYKAAQARLAKAHALDGKCQRGLPSADFIKKIPTDGPVVPLPPVLPPKT